MKKIGFIGIGAMGEPMVENLFKAGFDVTAYNRTAERLKSLKEKGVKTTTDLSEAVAQQDVVITMVSDDGAIDEIVNGPSGILQSTTPPTIFVNMSTVSPETSFRLYEQFMAQGINAIDAPVSGSSNAAQSAQLVVLAGGKREVVDSLSDVFGAMSKAVYYFGEAGSGSRAKLVINLALGLSMQAVSESLVLAEKFSLHRETVLDMMEQTAIASPLLKFKRTLLENREFPSAFALKLMQKDLRLIMNEARNTGAVLPTGSAAFESYTAALNRGMGDLDLAAVFEELLQASGFSEE